MPGNVEEELLFCRFLLDQATVWHFCRENAMIRAAGPNLTNILNGSAYGLMKNKWTLNEIKNFGEMLLYFSFKQCLAERPRTSNILRNVGQFLNLKNTVSRQILNKL